MLIHFYDDFAIETDDYTIVKDATNKQLILKSTDTEIRLVANTINALDNMLAILEYVFSNPEKIKDETMTFDRIEKDIRVRKAITHNEMYSFSIIKKQ